jgi:hypothetical protein
LAIASRQNSHEFAHLDSARLTPSACTTFRPQRKNAQGGRTREHDSERGPREQVQPADKNERSGDQHQEAPHEQLPKGPDALVLDQK